MTIDRGSDQHYELWADIYDALLQKKIKKLEERFEREWDEVAALLEPEVERAISANDR